MSAYTEGFATGPGAIDAAFQALRAHLVANGWTEHDVISNTSGSRNIVFRGGALDATADVRPFVQIQQTNTTTIAWTGYADYDTSTHTGIASAGGTASSGIASTDATFAYAFRFDSMGGVICFRNAGSWQRAYIGFVYRGLDTDESGITKATGALTAGATSISVASDMTGKIRVGQKIWVMNYAHNSASANAAKCESVTVSSVASGSIGVSALANNYDSGALVGENCCPLVIGNGGASQGTIGASTFYLPYNRDGSRTSATGQTAGCLAQNFGRNVDVDLADVSLRYGTGIFGFAENTAAKLDFKGFPRGGVFPAAGGSSGGGPSPDDLLTWGPYTYLLLDSSATAMTCVGPRET
jgi:hypothetical protein